jgi:Fic family protein
MTEDHKNSRRHSVAVEPSIVSDEKLRAEIEARNGLKQFDLGLRMIEEGISRGSAFRFRPSMIFALHREALEGLSSYAGMPRPASVGIEGSQHEPSGAHLVPELIEDMCDYINGEWASKTAVHLASYVMWRLNWIHPFSDGNGRTSRISSYLVLSVKLGYLLPGSCTIPDQIVENRKPYFDALEDADKNYSNGIIDLRLMEDFIERLLAVQLTKVLDSAAGKQRI